MSFPLHDWRLTASKQVKYLTTSGSVSSKPCHVFAILAGGDGVNNYTISIHDSTDNSGDKKIPDCTHKASDLGWKGVAPYEFACNTACYCDITTAGTIKVCVVYSEKP